MGHYGDGELARPPAQSLRWNKSLTSATAHQHETLRGPLLDRRPSPASVHEESRLHTRASAGSHRLFFRAVNAKGDRPCRA